MNNTIRNKTNLKRIQKSFLIIIVTFLMFSCNSSTEGVKNGLLEIEPDVFNFGELLQGDTAMLLYTIKNISKDTVIINKIHTGCDCILSKYPDYIRPHETAIVTLKYSTTGFLGPIENIFVIETDKLPIFYPIYFKGKINEQD